MNSIPEGQGNGEPGAALQPINYNSPREIRAAVERLGLALKRRWGQNFLINGDARKRIVELLEPDSGDAVWEVGPGLGTLTVLLLPRVRRLVAFEIDRGLIRHLHASFDKDPRFNLVGGDILKTWSAEADARGLPDRVLGNLPYSVASALIAAFAESRFAPEKMVFTVQRELAQRMTAVPGGKSYSSFSVLCRTAYEVSVAMQLKPGSFYPAPEVHSSVVVLRPNPSAAQIGAWAFFLRFIRRAFHSRRKTLRNNLLAGIAAEPAQTAALDRVYAELRIDPQVRAERLSPLQLLRFAEALRTRLEDL